MCTGPEASPQRLCLGCCLNTKAHIPTLTVSIKFLLDLNSACSTSRCYNLDKGSRVTHEWKCPMGLHESLVLLTACPKRKNTANRLTSNRRMLSCLLSPETASKWILLLHKEIMESYIKYIEISNNPMGNTAEN